jgi:hypothetical protein
VDVGERIPVHQVEGGPLAHRDGSQLGLAPEEAGTAQRRSGGKTRCVCPVGEGRFIR